MAVASYARAMVTALESSGKPRSDASTESIIKSVRVGPGYAAATPRVATVRVFVSSFSVVLSAADSIPSF